MLQRQRGCFPFSRSWRTACSQVLSSKLMLVLAIVYVLHSSSHHQSQAKYIQDTGNGTYYTFNCNQTWCGENWSANRILRYGYDVNDALKVICTNRTVHENNCSGKQNSLDCHSVTTNKIDCGPRRVVNISRQPVPKITKMPAMNLYLITTDNINKSSTTSDKYPLNQDKIWQLRIPKDCKMTVYFSLFDLHRSQLCANDSFSVQTSKNQQGIYRYCQSLHRLEIRRIKRVQMTFHSDSVGARGGIKGTVCLSNLHDPVTESDLESQLPCTCSVEPEARRRRKQSDIKPSRALRKRIAKEKVRVARWLHELMDGGQDVVDAFLRNPESNKQQHLAEQYQEVLRKHREW